MSLFKKTKESKEEGNEITNAQREVAATLERNVPPFITHLLMKEYYPLPSVDTILQTPNPYGTTKIIRHNGKISEIAIHKYTKELDEEIVTPNLFIADCDTTDDWYIDEWTKEQMLNSPNGEQIFNDCKYHVISFDTPYNLIETYKERATRLIDYLEFSLNLYPTCEGVMFLYSGKLISRDTILNSQNSKIGKFIDYAVSFRIMRNTETNSLLIDSLGMEALGMPDVQYHFTELDVDKVLEHAYGTLYYQLENNMQIKDGDTVGGIKGDNLMCPDVYWDCKYETSTVGPDRPVLTITTTEYMES